MRTLLTIFFFLVFFANACFSQGLSEPHELLIKKLFTSLVKEDTALFRKTCIPSFPIVEKIIKASYENSPELINKLATHSNYDSLAVHLKNRFLALIDTGKKEGINWSEVKISWIGIKGNEAGEKVWELDIPFHISFNQIEYRIVLVYCTRLKNDPKNILIGNIVWEGKTN